MDIAREGAPMTRKQINLLGKKYGRLQVIEKSFVKNGKRYWKCLCDCGNEIYVRTGSLTSGNSKSCGCYIYDRTKRTGKLSDIDVEKRNLYSNYKNQAKQRDIEFNLSFDDFIKLVTQSCYYCGIEPNIGNIFIHGGIDRIDNNRGYIKDNCNSCCKHCNYAKRDLTREQFLNLVKRIYITQYHKITDRTPGEIIDSLITADIKCFLAQEDMLKENLSDEERVIAGEKSQRYNAKRNSLISSINKVLDYSDDRIIEKTYAKKDDK